MTGITAALIVAIIFGAVSFRQYRRAERAKVSADQAAKRATLATGKIDATLRARSRMAAGVVAHSLQPAMGMRLTRSLPSALLLLRATRSSILTVS